MEEFSESQEAEDWAFRTFAGCYPHEAHGVDPERFYNYVRTKHPNLSNEDIINLLKDT